MNLFSHFIVLLALAVLAACEPADQGSEADGQTGMQAADNQTDQSRARTPAGSNNLSGEVLETMDAAGYTYALIQTDGQQVWVAGPQTPLKVGDEVTAMESMPMGAYHSDSLDRDFDNLYFVTAIRSGSVASEMQGDLTSGSSGTKETASEPQVVRMEPVEGARTIGQLFEDREALEGETVVVKGQVVKFNQAIMGRNWVHLQDGTGDADAGTHDLTVTTDDMAREGDVVTVSGVVALDKDFGAGYTYDLLIEQASISPE